ncbi:transcriptional regulator, LacI family [Chitinophaga terrae (ex Kim and Jung 2007)]|uniref:Transcriptional regulator, LacI family n=1 Tax=Chitinophaga terrae (ex Kim and Jung 2007) TaxID=408074 RepID=A0A1H3YJU6_9BACT|nr:substrate-binding domain-containing protein [Chitinophaga terrae (ex Kim and Jung 2007)]SEA11743.1 transcriptional regulator, LacI family [Chitinophaga terrae (ex Kim and Jung 2007)]
MIKCTRCSQVHAISKSGTVRGKQRYYCKDCNMYFTLPEEPAAEIRQHKKHMTTIVDIAKALNISKSTVSRALHEHSDINPQTKAAVLEMAQQLDYQPNLLAKSLVKSKSNTIGIIVPEFLTYFFPTIIMGAQQVAAQAGYNVIICQSQESYKTEVANANILLANRVDGVLISMTRETKKFDHIKAFEKHGIPVVFFNRVCDEMNTSKVLVNDYEGALKAVEHLIKNGYRNIAHIAGPPSLLLTRNRLGGYRDALKKYNLPFKEDLVVHCNLSKKDAVQCAEQLLNMKNRPDAVFCVNDPVAIQLMLEAKKRKIKIPSELGIVGFSNEPSGEVIEPALTTVQQPVADIGRSAADILLTAIKQGEDYVPEMKSLKTTLIVRESSKR